MDKYHRLKGRRLTALFFGGILLFNYPLLAIFSHSGFIGGIPVLYIYVFAAWLVIIALTALVIERR